MERGIQFSFRAWAMVWLAAGCWMVSESSRAVPPGGLWPVRAELPMAQGRVGPVHVLADGAVALRGDFSAINGTPCSGLARLMPSGARDDRFRPAVVDVSGQPPIDLNGWVPIQTGGRFVEMADGTLLYAFSSHILAYRRDGSLDPRFMALQQADGRVETLFETTGRLYVIRSDLSGRQLEAFRSDTLAPVPLSAPADWPMSLLDAVPASGGSLWVLGREVLEESTWNWTIPTYTLFRVDADGALDPTFAPMDLPGDTTYSLSPRIGGGFCLMGEDRHGWMLWPSPTCRSCGIGWYDADGRLDRSHGVCQPLTVPLLLAEEADGSLLHNAVEADPEAHPEDGPGNVLIRIRPDGTRDPDFRVRLHAFSLQVLPDGRIQHSCFHRVLRDGTPDPAWQLPQVAGDPDILIVGRFDDGGIVVREKGAGLDGNPFPLRVLGSDLRADISFQPSPDLPAIQSVRMSHDKRSLVLVLGTCHEFPDGTKTRMLRLRRDGSIDPDSPRYRPAGNFFLWDPLTGNITASAHEGGFEVQPLSDGGFFIQYQLDRGDVWQNVRQRIHPDGSVDSGFSFGVDSYRNTSIFVMSDDRMIADSRLYAVDGAFERDLPFPAQSNPVLELPDGRLLLQTWEGNAHQLILADLQTGVDPAFQTGFLEGTRIHQVVSVNGGYWVVAGLLQTPFGEQPLVRLLPDGRLDPVFQAPPLSRAVPWSDGLWWVIREGEPVLASLANRSVPAAIHSLLPLLEDEALLVGGDFTHADGLPLGGVAKLSVSRVRTFEAWRNALFRNEGIDGGGDENGDLSSLLVDYALGQDSSSPDRVRGWIQPRPGMSGSFRVPVNPDAEDVQVIVDVSDDLRSWREAWEGGVTVENDASGLVVGFPGDRAVGFFRIRVRRMSP